MNILSLFAIALFLFVYQLPAYSADTVYPDRPKDIRISGTLLPVGAQATEDLVTVNIFLGDTPRILRIGKLEAL